MFYNSRILHGYAQCVGLPDYFLQLVSFGQLIVHCTHVRQDQLSHFPITKPIKGKSIQGGVKIETRDIKASVSPITFSASRAFVHNEWAERS